MKKRVLILIYSLGVFCFSFLGFFKVNSGLNADGAAFFRGFFGILVLLLFSLAVKPRILKAKASYMLRSIFWGMLMGLAVIFYFKTMDSSNQSIAALLLCTQVFWYPIYTSLLSKHDLVKINWFVYSAAILLSFVGIYFMLDISYSALQIQGNVLFWGLLSSFTAFLYYVAGRWFFFNTNKNEKHFVLLFVQKFNLSNLYYSLLQDEKSSTKELTDFWQSYQKTVFQVIGMFAVTLINLSNKEINLSLSDTYAVLNSIALGVVGLAIPFLLITYADSASFRNLKTHKFEKINPAVKGISQQIEPIGMLLVGYLLLNIEMSVSNIIGSIIFLLSYLTIIFYLEKK